MKKLLVLSLVLPFFGCEHTTHEAKTLATTPSQEIPCTTGTQNACPDGMVCKKNPDSMPGGPGTCQPAT